MNLVSQCLQPTEVVAVVVVAVVDVVVVVVVVVDDDDVDENHTSPMEQQHDLTLRIPPPLPIE